MHPLLAMTDFSALKTALQAAVGNLFIAGLGVGSLVFLFKREILRFAEFAILGVLVGTFVYAGDQWVSLIKTAATTILG